MASITDTFTPMFIIVILVVFICGLVLLQFISKMFIGSNNLNAIQMFGLTILINIMILIFLVMSFSKVNLTQGPQGPIGNKGDKGITGVDGTLAVCSVKYQNAENKKHNKIKTIDAEYDTKLPLIYYDASYPKNVTN
jgi:hypothetical protein